MKYLIIDIDGIAEPVTYETLEEFNDLVRQDKIEPSMGVINTIKQYLSLHPNIKPVFLTARCVSLLKPTVDWLDKHTGIVGQILMRYQNDKRPDPQYKISMLEDEGIFAAQVVCWIEDRYDVYNMAQSRGYFVIYPEDVHYWLEIHKPEQKQTDEGFKKFDSEKPDLGIIPGILIEAYTTVGSHGARKYGKFNYRKAQLNDIPRYHSALLRHYFGFTDKESKKHGFLNGNILDHDSGLNELWQAYWNLGAIIEACEKYGYEAVSKEIRGD